MTISSTVVKYVSAWGDGSTDEYTLDPTLIFQDGEQLLVYLESQTTTPYTRTLLVYGAGAGKYTYIQDTLASGLLGPITGILLGTPPTANERVVVARSTALTQTVDYTATSFFPAADHAEQMDRQVMMLQEVKSELDRKIGLDPASTSTPPVFPEPLANGIVRFNSDASALEAVELANLGITPALVGSDTAQWNASAIQGVPALIANPANGKALVYRDGALILEPQSVPSIAEGQIYVGDATGLPVAVSVTGDVSLASDGTATVTTVGGEDAVDIAATVQVVSVADTSNTPETLVKRDASGNFAANIITATLNGTASGLSGTLPISQGGTGQTTFFEARRALVAQPGFNGLEDPSTIEVTYDPVTRTFTITSTGTTYIYANGTRYSFTGVTTKTHAATQGMWYLKYTSADATFILSQTPWNLLLDAPIASAYYNASNVYVSILYDERHAGTTGMSPATHLWAHTTIGTRIYAGGVPSGYTLNTSGTGGVRYAISQASIADEDLQFTCAAIPANGAKSVWYKLGSSSTPRWEYTSTLNCFLDNGTDIYYNQNNAGTWQQTAMGNGYVNHWLVANTAYSEPRFWVVMGQATYATLALAQAATWSSEISDFNLLTNEGVILHRITYQRSNAFGAPGNVRIAAVQAVNQSIVGTGTLTPSVLASAITVDVTNFNGLLSSSEDSVQEALDKLDNFPRFAADTVWNGTDTTKDVDVSASISDSRQCIWQISANASDYEVLGVSITKPTVGSVRITSDPPLAAGSYRLTGIQCG